jgi:hypothetical protein
MIMRSEIPRNTGTDADGVAQCEADHFENARFARNGLTCATSPRSSSTSTTAKLKFWRGQHRHAIRRCTNTVGGCELAVDGAADRVRVAVDRRLVVGDCGDL